MRGTDHALDKIKNGASCWIVNANDPPPEGNGKSVNVVLESMVPVCVFILL